MQRLCSLLALFLAWGSAFAEIEKIATPCDPGICFHWWPRLPFVPGWHHDREHSISLNVNAQAPDANTFANAEAVIYANAPFKPRIPDVKTLQNLIENDQRKFRKDFRGVEIREIGTILTSDGKALRSFEYAPAATGNWERVSYGEEGDFYLVFTFSSRTKTGLAKASAAYGAFIGAYRSGP
jgi:hypothetical protein